MSFGHVTVGGAISLFGEKEGRRIAVGSLVPEAPRTLDDLVRDPDGLAGAIDALEEAFGRGEGAAVAEDDPLLPPILAPGKIIAIGLNYYDHCREFGSQPQTEPILFAKFPSSLCGHGDEVCWDTSVTAEVDWEAELGVVIGRTARDVDDEDVARRSIVGYTIVNDVTARDVQRNEQQWVRPKSLDSFCPMGPVMVTADKIEDPQNLTVRSRVNGEKMQDSSTKEIFGVFDLVSRLSRSFTLEPGDVIATGTPWE